MSDRVGQAVASPRAVIGAEGLVAIFNDAGVLDPLDVASAQAVARLHGETDPRVILAAALTVRGTRFGHVCVDLDSLAEAVAVEGRDPGIIDALPWPDTAEWKSALAESVMVGDGTGGHPLVFEEGRLYLQRYHRYERRVADLLLERLGAPHTIVPAPVRARLDDLLASAGPTRQHTAALQALSGKVAVIAGGPGTGKTYTVGALLAALAAAGSDGFPLVALCAPTGKAAARLGEAIEEAAEREGGEAASLLAQVRPSTIHRLLGWSWRRGAFERNATNRLPHDLVIVDEMSMVSLPLAAKLLEAVRDDATVVLVGDPFQLESIEAGTVLADIVGPIDDADRSRSDLASRVVVLDRGHRFTEDSSIADFADAIRRGDADRALDLLIGNDDRLRWAPDPSSPAFKEMWAEVVGERTRLVQSALEGNATAALQHLTSIAVLAARREGSDGVSHWSREVETALDERFPGLRWRGEWYAGRPVMITRNDYNLDLYNGDIGVAVDTDDGLRAVFERGDARTFPLSHLTEHQTVHAMTIHKSQGSQFDQVVVVLPDSESRLLTRELLYTAVTRARSRVWLVGSEDVIRQAVSRSVQRASGLSRLLWGPPARTSPSQTPNSSA